MAAQLTKDTVVSSLRILADELEKMQVTIAEATCCQQHEVLLHSWDRSIMDFKKGPLETWTIEIKLNHGD